MIHSAKPIVGSSLLRGTVIAATMSSVAQSLPTRAGGSPACHRNFPTKQTNPSQL